MTHNQKVRQALDRCGEEADRCFAELAKNLDASKPDPTLLRTYINETFDKTMRQVFDLIPDKNTLEKGMELIGNGICRMVYQLPVASVIDDAFGKLVAISLFGRVTFWRSEYSKQQRELSQTKLTVVPQPEQFRRKKQLEATYPKRAEWLRQEMMNRDLSPNSFMNLHGPDPKTVRKIMNGETVGPKPIGKLALSLGIDANKIPRG